MRIAVVGPGVWTMLYLMPALTAHPEARVVAFCGRDPERTRSAASQCGVPHAYTAVDELLAAEDLDALLVLSPPSNHVSACLHGACAGLALYCEKPLGVTAAQTRTLLDASVGLRTAVGFTSRWDPAVRHVVELVRGGDLGAVRNVRVSYANSVVADPQHPWRWRFDPAEYPLGVLTDLGSHAFDLARWVGGDITSVAAGGTVVHSERDDPAAGVRRAVTNFDEAQARVDYVTGASGSIWCSRVTSPAYGPGRFELEVIGSQATALVTSEHPGQVGLSSGGQIRHRGLRPAPGAGEQTDLLELMRERARLQVTEVLSHLDRHQSAQAAVPDFVAGHACQRLLDAAGRSLADGGRPTPIDIDHSHPLPNGDQGDT